MTDTTNQAQPATCGSGCACAAKCGDTYAANGLPKPPRARPSLTIRSLSVAAAMAADAALHESEARHLIDYIHDLERRHSELERRTREGTAGLRPPVIAFAWLMEHKLRKHDDTRGACGWMHEHPAALRDRIDVAGNELARALVDRGLDDGQAQERATRRLASKCADVANFAMMTADVVGALEDVGPGPIAKMRNRTRQVHRLYAHITRLLDRKRTETPPAPEKKLLALEADVRALEWVLQVLDPHGLHAPTPYVTGDGTGQALPPASTEQRTAAGTNEPPQPIEQVALA